MYILQNSTTDTFQVQVQTHPREMLTRTDMRKSWTYVYDQIYEPSRKSGARLLLLKVTRRGSYKPSVKIRACQGNEQQSISSKES